MRDPGVITALGALERYARAFDAISAEAEARYSATAFVKWVQLETRAFCDRRNGECDDHDLGEAGEFGL